MSPQGPPRLDWIADFALRISFGEHIDAEVSRRVAQAYAALSNPRTSGNRSDIPGIAAITPAYTSLLLKFAPDFDPLVSEARVRDAISHSDVTGSVSTRTIAIPVCYHEDLAVDLSDCAASANMSREQFVERHAAAEYSVAFLGFTPGFAYLLGLPTELAIPRLDSPRPSVAPGSVAIGAEQAGIYPFASPGGWRIVGRTPLRMFDARRNPPARLAIGDQVRFRPISRDEFDQWEDRDVP